MRCEIGVGADRQVLRTDKAPTRASKDLGSAAIVINVSDEALNKRSSDRRLAVTGDLGDGGRQREHEAIIGNRQGFGFTLGEPGSGRRALAFRDLPPIFVEHRELP